MSRRKKAEARGTPVLTMDAFSNPLFRLGYGSQAPLEAAEYPLTRLTDNYALRYLPERGQHHPQRHDPEMV